MRVLMWEHFAPGGPHFAERFLRRGDQVAWCAGPVSPVNLAGGNDEIRARMRLWRRGGEWADRRGLFAYSPMTLLPHRRRWLLDSAAVGRLTLRATLPGLRGVLRRAGFDRFDLLFMEPGAPLVALLDAFPGTPSVYRMCDDTAAFPDTPRSFGALEREACRRADLVIATARRLVDHAGAIGARRVLYLPNACDPAAFAPASVAEPPDLADLPRPRAVYAGALDGWFDADLVAEVARRRPGWSFALIGPARADLAPLGGLGNVRLLGPRPYTALPGYFAASDAGIVPFRLTPMTHAIHPIKVYEYLAAGLQVVATPMQETAAMGAPIALADDAAGFAARLDEALRCGAAARDSRLAYARANSWDARFAALLEAVGAAPGREAAAVGSGTARLAAGGRA
jgi:glycosyltransferase involved in cell wall biosynthesis